ncbi:NAD(P)-binding protein, partial [Aureobasidium melanogenum]
MSSDDKINTAYNIDIKAQDQAPGAGLDSQLDPPANWTQLEFWDDDENPHLEEYEGRGLLKNKAVLITGGDSGIGRSVAILMAREGADITICYLPEEQEDADWTLEQIKKAGRKGH